MHLYGTEPEAFRPGDATVTVGDIAGIGRTGLCVCFDGDFPETARALRAAGADLVLHPSAYEAAAENLAVDDELSAAAAVGAMLWPAAAGAPALSAPLPPRRTEEVS